MNLSSPTAHAAPGGYPAARNTDRYVEVVARSADAQDPVAAANLRLLNEIRKSVDFASSLLVALLVSSIILIVLTLFRL